MSNCPIIPKELASQKFHNAMSAFVGFGRKWSCATVSAATGINRRTVESYLSGQATPTIEKYQSLCVVLGEAFMDATLEATQYKVRSVEPGDTTIQKTLSSLLQTAKSVSIALEDGRIDHRERVELRKEFGALSEQVSAVMALLNQPDVSGGE